MELDMEILSGNDIYDPHPPYNRALAIQLLHTAGLSQPEAIGWTRIGPELLREHLEASPHLVVSEYLMRMVGIKYNF